MTFVISVARKSLAPRSARFFARWMASSELFPTANILQRSKSEKYIFHQAAIMAKRAVETVVKQQKV